MSWIRHFTAHMHPITWTVTLAATLQAAAKEWRQRLADRMMVSNGVASLLRSSWMAQADTVAAQRLGTPAQTVQHGKALPNVAATTAQPTSQHTAVPEERQQQVRMLGRDGNLLR